MSLSWMAVLLLASTSSTAQTVDTSSMAAELEELRELVKKKTKPSVRTEPGQESVGPAPPTISFDKRMADAGASMGVYTRISSVIPSDESFAVTSPIGALVRIEVGAEFAPTSPVEGFAVQLGIAAGAQSRRIYDSYNGLLGLTSLHVSGVYRLPIWTYFSTYARVTGGVDWAHLSLREEVRGTEIDDVAVGFSGAGTLGTELAVPVGYTKQGSGEVADQWLGFYFEVGYALHTAHEFDELARDTNDDTEPARIRRVGTDGGDVDLSGVVWRMGAAFRF